ncbi:hypothetical protein [Acidovorax sp.]|uniref:hypothetical protein n=1 Tax=Acidovorax sp. TaxID=1872122 RepID=UPI00391B3FD1
MPSKAAQTGLEPRYLSPAGGATRGTAQASATVALAWAVPLPRRVDGVVLG